LDDGYNAAEQLFKRKDLPTAVFCTNDAIAYGFLDYCSRAKIKVPDSISVVGVDDNRYSSLDSINLTTVKDPIDEISKIAIEILSNKIINDDKSRITKTIKPDIIFRSSVKRIKS
jgi:LacI family transcriptional regulator